ncbi:hypothetical protein C8R43DRAFT_1037612 [Mycena crocata]|nr:hypothetical protein C8R43DRAFT_1037612 [Mycena crocata]
MLVFGRTVSMTCFRHEANIDGTLAANPRPNRHNPEGSARTATNGHLLRNTEPDHQVIAGDPGNNGRNHVNEFAEPIAGTTFNHVGGNVVQYSMTSYGESGVNALLNHVSMEALHDSGERFPEPACHPGTRTAILEKLASWSIDTEPQSSIMWTHGSAGVGKSAIAQMFSGNCQHEGTLGASFFFRRRHQTRGTWHKLIPTIAYQLATAVPELLLPLQQVLARDRLIVGRALAVQFRRLLVEPFAEISLPKNLPVIVIDGLDECEDHKVQQEILQLFITAIQAHQLPIRLMITSRPEPHIREVLQTSATVGICSSAEISADQAAYEDIRKYLVDQFTRIRSQNAVRGIHLGRVWPAADELTHLVGKSSGIFVYATTVIRFVDDEYSHPQERLQSVLSLDPQSTAPLDDLYTKILSAVPPVPRNLLIVHVIWRGRWLAAEEIDDVLNFSQGTSRRTLRPLHSLFDVPPIATRFSLRYRVGFLHKSFEDFLVDGRRSGPWCVAMPWLQTDYLHGIIHLLSSPPITYSTRGLYCQLVRDLPALLGNAAPSDILVCALRNKAFQESLFLVDDVLQWPQRDSWYPSDLVELWEDHQFIGTFLRNIEEETSGQPTLQFDSMYASIFQQHPEVLFVLRAQTVWRIDGRTAFIGISETLLHLGSTIRIFTPFLKLRNAVPSPCNFFPSDSPLDFLFDPNRAGELYMDPADIIEDLVLFWISRAKEFITHSDAIPDAQWLLLLDELDARPRLLHELETLDLSSLCSLCAQKPRDHIGIHHYAVKPANLQAVVNYLRRFSDPPKDTIQFWERQLTDVTQCTKNLRMLDEEGNYYYY